MVVMLLEGRQPRARLAIPHLIRILLAALLSGNGHDLAGAVLVCRVVKKSADVVDKQRIKKLCDFFLVGEVERPVKRDPDTLQVHRANLDDMSYFFALQDAIATTAGHARHVQQFCAVDHVVIFSAGDANAASFYLEA